MDRNHAPLRQILVWPSTKCGVQTQTKGVPNLQGPESRGPATKGRLVCGETGVMVKPDSQGRHANSKLPAFFGIKPQRSGAEDSVLGP